MSQENKEGLTIIARRGVRIAGKHIPAGVKTNIVADQTSIMMSLPVVYVERDGEVLKDTRTKSEKNGDYGVAAPAPADSDEEAPKPKRGAKNAAANV